MQCFHKANHEDVTEQHQQMDIVKVNDDNDKSSLQALIEKVVNDEIKKLAQEMVGASGEVIKLSSAPLLDVDSVTEAATSETTMTPAGDTMEPESTELSDTPESSDVCSETELPAAAVAADFIKVETTETAPTEGNVEVSSEGETTTSASEPDESVTEESSISDSLLSAVGDLLSSILGLDSSDSKKTFEADDESAEESVNIDAKDVDSDAISQEAIAQTSEPEPAPTTTMPESEASIEVTKIERDTETLDETTTAGGEVNIEEDEEESGETTTTEPLKISNVDSNEVQDKPTNEIDLKIENLSSAQTSFVTENTPEQVTETVTDELSEGVKSEPDVLEVLAVIANDGDKLNSFDASINQVMNLVKGTEGRLALESVGSVVDSILIDKHMKDDVNDLDQIVYGTLKEIEDSMGMNEGAHMPADDHLREDLIKDFETEITRSLINTNFYENDDFVANSAKAALHYKREDEADF